MWVIIDGNNWYSRAFYALTPTESQEPGVIKADLDLRCVRSVQTVLRWIEDTERQLKPTTLAICWDSRKSFRKELCDKYKGHKGEKAEGYYSAMDALRLRLKDYQQRESSGFEADDLLAGFARDAVDEGEKCLLCSSDKDMHQCLTAGFVSQCTKMKRTEGISGLDFRVLNAEGLFKKYGVTPSQWIDYRCMTGDKSDGLPGVDGIGPKNAMEVLVACGTLDGFYAEPFKAQIAVAKRNALLEFKSQLPLMRELITLRPDALRNVGVPV